MLKFSFIFNRGIFLVKLFSLPAKSFKKFQLFVNHLLRLRVSYGTASSIAPENVPSNKFPKLYGQWMCWFKQRGNSASLLKALESVFLPILLVAGSQFLGLDREDILNLISLWSEKLNSLAEIRETRSLSLVRIRSSTFPLWWVASLIANLFKPFSLNSRWDNNSCINNHWNYTLTSN